MSLISGNGSKERSLDAKMRSRVARIVFGNCEAMGISDRDQIEEITSQVIRLLEETPGESAPVLPGMEHLVVKVDSRAKGVPTEIEIETAFKTVTASGKPAATVAREIPEATKKEPVMTIALATAKKAHGASFTDNARQVLAKRYLKKDKEGKPTETPEDMLHRVAKTIAQAELIYDPKADVKAKEDEFLGVMMSLDFMPNSPTLMNAGRELGQLSACFVLPVEDSMESIFDAVKFTALIHKSGGGTGFSFSRLRPESDRVGTTGGVASGPVSFMRAFDTATDVIKQGGMRRGANMGILNVDHPDIEKFIEAKKEQNALNNFNISVAVTREFMEAVKTGADYELINPRTHEKAGKKNAKEVFKKITEMAWKTGDPGIIFIDRINEDNPTPNLGNIESTNPCGEQPLLPYESCNLGSINLANMLKGKAGEKTIDQEHLSRVVRTAINFLDNVIDINKFPLPEIEKKTKLTRKIGLGVMGYADMLIHMGIPYDSDRALDKAEKVMDYIHSEATEASIELANKRGVFPAFEGSKYSALNLRVRNATRTTIAPTGTISIITGVSSGIEPLFALSFVRNILDGAQLVEVNPIFEEVARERGFYSEELMKKLATGTKLHEIDGIPEDVKRVFVTAHEITPEWHVKTQAAFQKSTNNAVSKTVNFPHEATRDDVAKVYMMAYEAGLKGITIYRDRSRESQVLTTGKAEKPEAKAETTGITPRKRTKITIGVTEMVNTGCGHLYVTVNSDEKGIFEVFSHLGKAGGCATAQLEAICRLISTALRSGVDAGSIAEQLRGIRCPSIAWEEGKAILSCADAIASVIEKRLENKPKQNNPSAGKSEPPKNVAGQCPDCGNLLVYEEGCFKCPSCGYTKC
ncbi:MAG: vitamin B12-dependent ribonucleotide reductase [Chloroflexota bacterium]